MPLSDIQQELRMFGIGASEAASVLGMSKFKTTLDLWRHKRRLVGRRPRADDLDAPRAWGSALEGAIIDRFEHETGLKGERFPPTVISHTYPFMLATFDWVGKDRVVDAKLAFVDDEWGAPGTDEIPRAYNIQLHHQMIVAAVDFAQIAMFAVLPAGRGRARMEFRTYDVPYNSKLGDLIIDAEREFWDMVLNDTPPAPVDLADAVRLYERRARMNAVIADDDTLDYVQQLADATQEAKRLSERIEELQNRIKVYMKESDTLIHDGKVLASWKMDAAGAKRIDLKKLRAEFGDAARACEYESDPVRRFLPKFTSQAKLPKPSAATALEHKQEQE